MTQGLAAVAQTQPTNTPPALADTNALTALPEVVVEGQRSPYQAGTVSSPKYTEPIRDIPQTITVVPPAVIQEQGATSLRDVLRNVSGISMQAGEGGGGLPGDNLSIRGFSARNDIYLDGVRDYGAYSRDLFNTEQVEVIKGPSSANGGRGSAGGSINLVSKKPRLNSFYSGALSLGTDEYKRVTIDVNQPLAPGNETWWGSSALRLNGMWTDADVPGRDVVENKSWAIAPTITFGLGTPTRVALAYQHLAQDNVPDYGIPWVPANTNSVLERYSNAAPPVDFDNFYGLRNYDFEDIENDMVTGAIEHDFNPALTLRNLTRYTTTYRNSAITSPRFINANVSTLLNRQLQRREIENDIIINQTDLTTRFSTGPVDHAVVAGFEFSRENQENRNSAQATNQPPADLFNPNPYQQPFGPMPPISGLRSEATADTVAPYVFDTLKMGEREQWQLNAGVRFDHVDSEYKVGTTNLSRTDNLPSWRAGLVYKPRENGSVYFGYGTSFTSALDGNTGLVLSGATNNLNNVNLDPEETRSFELGTKWDFFARRLLIGAALFRTEKINARTQTTAGDTVTLDGEQTVAGVEFEIEGSLTEAWKVFGTYTYMESEIEESNNPTEVGAEFSNAPNHSFSLWTTYSFPWHLDVGTGVRYVGERFNGQSNSATARVAPDYFVVDAMLAYRVNRNITLRLNVYNLADERYIDSLGGGHFVPGEGRSAMLTAEFRF